MRLLGIIPLLTVLAGIGCGDPAAQPPSIVHMESPAGPASAQANLSSAPDGTIYLSWIEQPHVDGPHELRLARLAGDEWQHIGEIASGTDWFVNWADFPSVAATSRNTLFAHFLKKSTTQTYAYHVMLTHSSDGGTTWSDPQRLHTDTSATEHGFVTLLPLSESELLGVWLDGRNTGHSHDASGAMTLRSARIRANGEITSRSIVDERVCDCCQTTAARVGSNILVGYRDRSDEEIRDIAVARHDGDRWREATTVGSDKWEIAGCPVNGPSMAAVEDRVAVVWFTAAGDNPRVQASLSSDGGRTFDAPRRIDEGSPLGRVSIDFLDDGRALVVWMESTGDGAAVRARAVSGAGVTEAIEVAATSAGRASGFPRLVTDGDVGYVAWISTGPGRQDQQVHVTQITFN